MKIHDWNIKKNCLKVKEHLQKMQITTKTFSILLRRIDFSCIDVFGLAYCQPNFELFSPGRCWGALKYLHAAGTYPVANLSIWFRSGLLVCDIQLSKNNWWRFSLKTPLFRDPFFLQIIIQRPQVLLMLHFRKYRINCFFIDF